MRTESEIGAFRSRLAELLSPSPLIVALIVGVLLGVVELGLFLRLWFAVLVLIYAFWIVANYFLEIVEFKALGHDGWPVFSYETLVAGRNQAGIVFFALVLAVAGGYFALRYFAMGASASAVLGVGLAFLPGSAALLAATRRFSAALNPLGILAAAVGMGHAYLYCLLGAAAVLVLVGLAQARGGLWYFPLGYGLFLQAFMIGSIVYARRNVLGLNAPRSPEARAERARAETVAARNSVLSHAYGLAARGNIAGALAHVEAYIATEENTLEARLWMLTEIARWEDAGTALELGKRVVDYCERHGLADEAARARLLCDHLSAPRRADSAREVTLFSPRRTGAPPLRRLDPKDHHGKAMLFTVSVLPAVSVEK